MPKTTAVYLRATPDGVCELEVRDERSGGYLGRLRIVGLVPAQALVLHQIERPREVPESEVC